MSKQHTTQNTNRGRVDLAKLEATTAADIERHAWEDDDLWTDEMLAKAHRVPMTKENIHIRVDPDVLDFFRREGRGYQSRINAVLRAYVEAHARKAG
jgi:uncharacterized protein (DUF4415 family)